MAGDGREKVVPGPGAILSVLIPLLFFVTGGTG
jgi:hypothetical protein